jgi:hypothetical protein
MSARGKIVSLRQRVGFGRMCYAQIWNLGCGTRFRGGNGNLCDYEGTMRDLLWFYQGARLHVVWICVLRVLLAFTYGSGAAPVSFFLCMGCMSGNLFFGFGGSSENARTVSDTGMCVTVFNWILGVYSLQHVGECTSSASAFLILFIHSFVRSHSKLYLYICEMKLSLPNPLRCPCNRRRAASSWASIPW